MTDLWLFLRSRRIGAAVAVLLVAALAARILRTQTFGVGSTEPLAVPWATLVPLVQAGSITTTVLSAQPLAEATAIRFLPAIQLVTLTLLTAVCAVTNVWSAEGMTGPITVLAFDRNLLGMLGLALLSARLLGGTLFWILPVLAMTTALTLGSSTGADRVWAWPIQADTDSVAAIVAATLTVAAVPAGWHIFDRSRTIWN